jgi:itaconate CoA-transferase
VIIGIQNEREWKVFCERVLQRPELASDPRFDSNSQRVANRESLGSILATAFSRYKMKELVDLLDASGIANSQMNSLEDVWKHPQLAFRKRWRMVGSSVGLIPALLPPGMPEGCEPRFDPIPALGAHVDSILTELGYTQADINLLRTERVV